MRLKDIPIPGSSIIGPAGIMVCMAVADNYVMWRYSGFAPSVMPLKKWVALKKSSEQPTAPIVPKK